MNFYCNVRLLVALVFRSNGIDWISLMLSCPLADSWSFEAEKLSDYKDCNWYDELEFDSTRIHSSFFSSFIVICALSSTTSVLCWSIFSLMYFFSYFFFFCYRLRFIFCMTFLQSRIRECAYWIRSRIMPIVRQTTVTYTIDHPTYSRLSKSNTQSVVQNRW